MEKESIKVMARNREAYHEYFVEEEMEAGIELKGTEVKSIRAGTLNLKDAWCGIKDGEMILNQMHISPYDHGNRFNPDARRLLMSKPGLSNAGNPLNRYDYANIAFSLGNRQAVDSMAARLKEDGYSILSGPRTTGDGYYESCILDMEGNQLELTV